MARTWLGGVSHFHILVSLNAEPLQCETQTVELRDSTPIRIPFDGRYVSSGGFCDLVLKRVTFRAPYHIMLAHVTGFVPTLDVKGQSRGEEDDIAEVSSRPTHRNR